MKRQETELEKRDRQLDADLKLVMGPLSCAPGFLKRRNEALDRLVAFEPTVPWERWRWDGRPGSFKGVLGGLFQ